MEDRAKKVGRISGKVKKREQAAIDGQRALRLRFDNFHPASSVASQAKRACGKRDTRPELLLRRALHAAGARYRLHGKDITGSPDILFRTERVAVFCDGDFWHGRDWPTLRSKLLKRHNAEYWVSKIARNRERDCEQTASLMGQGWLVLRLWESDILSDPEAAATRVIEAVHARRLVPAGRPCEHLRDAD